VAGVLGSDHSRRLNVFRDEKWQGLNGRTRVGFFSERGVAIHFVKKEKKGCVGRPAKKLAKCRHNKTWREFQGGSVPRLRAFLRLSPNRRGRADAHRRKIWQKNVGRAATLLFWGREKRQDFIFRPGPKAGGSPEKKTVGKKTRTFGSARV